MPGTEWLYRAIVVIPWATRDQVNADIRDSVNPGGFETFNLKANAAGSGTPTHSYCNSALNVAGVEFLEEKAPLIPGGEAWVWVAHADGDKAWLDAKCNPLSNVNVMNDEQDIDDVLTSRLLQRFDEPDEGGGNPL